MIWTLLGNIFKDILGGVADHFQNKRELKRAIKLAEIEAYNKMQTADIEWDQIMAKNSGDSWKDEWFTLLLSIPAIMAFFPGLAQYVEAGFAVLSDMPDWYLYAFGTAVAAAFGRNQLINFMKTKK